MVNWKPAQETSSYMLHFMMTILKVFEISRYQDINIVQCHLLYQQCRDFVRLQSLHAASYSDDGIISLCVHRGHTFGRGVFKCSPTDLDILNLKKYNPHHTVYKVVLIFSPGC